MFQFEPGDEPDIEEMKKLYQVTRMIMLLKGVNAQLAEEELQNATQATSHDRAKKGKKNK